MTDKQLKKCGKDMHKATRRTTRLRDFLADEVNSFTEGESFFRYTYFTIPS